ASASYTYAGDANHMGSSDSKEFTIGKAALTVTTDPKSRVYGDTNPAFTGSITGIQNSDNITATYTSLATAASAVGGYAVTATLSDPTNKLGNYTVTNAGNTLTVTPAAISVKANDAARMQGAANPIFTGAITGIKNGDAITASYSTVATETSPAGEYAIVPELSGDKLRNYQTPEIIKGKLIVYLVPVIAIVNPAPTETGKVVSVEAAYTGTITSPKWIWSFNVSGTDGALATGSKVTGSTTAPTTPGVYTVKLSYQNAMGENKESESVFVTVYDPNGGFVTGGGWINSPKGAIRTSSYGLAGGDATGKANFGFVAKYKNGKTNLPEVDGNTEFQFTAGNLNFKSSSLEAMSLVVTSDKATYKGVGIMNGITGFKFTVIAIDGDVKGKLNNDKFRIRIWDASNALVYDNLVGSTGAEDYTEASDFIGGGSIVIHDASVKGGSTTSKAVVASAVKSELPTTQFYNYPNTFSNRTTIAFSLDKAQDFALEVYDVRGALVKKVVSGVAEAGKVYEYDLDAHNMSEGIYFGRLITSSGAQTIKMLLKK
uniref:MBG domain-containing protein n=1 Tax=Pontibacter chitinilyticus TaxID=2674989 RepID=UPI00321B2AD7